ncbi:uncharacterized protein LOC105703872 isoform X2 [Orussus abietinus]|uniref:uncharacterized protein LOC105703872 isoform X2 n=1 Tax=Orussus abietinus TaxID=222816 RepID=UPI00062647D7|nr:uncharacterized protein LOC105703872 isoform X2 [Orussus abietinus]
MLGRPRERQYQLAAQKRNEASIKYNYYRETAKYFERQSEVARHFSSWSTPNMNSKFQKNSEKEMEAEKLRVRQEKLAKMLAHEEELYKKQLEHAHSKKKNQVDPSLELLKKRIEEKRAELSLYLPKSGRKGEREKREINVEPSGVSCPRDSDDTKPKKTADFEDSHYYQPEPPSHPRVTSREEHEIPPRDSFPGTTSRYSERRHYNSGYNNDEEPAEGIHKSKDITLAQDPDEADSKKVSNSEENRYYQTQDKSPSFQESKPSREWEVPCRTSVPGATSRYSERKHYKSDYNNDEEPAEGIHKSKDITPAQDPDEVNAKKISNSDENRYYQTDGKSCFQESKPSKEWEVPCRTSVPGATSRYSEKKHYKSSYNNDEEPTEGIHKMSVIASAQDPDEPISCRTTEFEYNPRRETDMHFNESENAETYERPCNTNVLGTALKYSEKRHFHPSDASKGEELEKGSGAINDRVLNREEETVFRRPATTKDYIVTKDAEDRDVPSRVNVHGSSSGYSERKHFYAPQNIQGDESGIRGHPGATAQCLHKSLEGTNVGDGDAYGSEGKTSRVSPSADLRPGERSHEIPVNSSTFEDHEREPSEQSKPSTPELLSREEIEDREDLITDSERNFPWMRNDVNEGNTSHHRSSFLTHNELKFQIQNLLKRELQACSKQNYDEALRLRSMRCHLELIREKNLYGNTDLHMDDEARNSGLENIERRKRQLESRDRNCNNSTIYSDEAKLLWKQWVHEDDEYELADARNQREVLLKQLEEEWHQMESVDKKHASQEMNNFSRSTLQDEHKLTARITNILNLRDANASE